MANERKEIELIILTSLITTFSIASHIISFNIYSFNNFVFIPSSITYMLVIALLDYSSVYYSRRLVISMIIIESLSNAMLFCLIKGSFIYNISSLSPIEDSLKNILLYFEKMYLANIVGTLIALLINNYIFTFFLKKTNFLTSSFISSTIFILLYTPATDFIAFHDVVDLKNKNLISFNIITNMISFLIWSLSLNSLIKWRRKND